MKKNSDILTKEEIDWLAIQSLQDQFKKNTPTNVSIAVKDVKTYLKDIFILPDEWFNEIEYNHIRSLSIEEAWKLLWFPITSLREHNIKTLADLLQTPLFDISRLPSVWVKKAEKIRYALEKKSLHLGKKFPHNIIPDDFILEDLLATLYPSQTVQDLKMQWIFTYGQYKDIRDTLIVQQRTAVDRLIEKIRKD